MGLFSSFVRKLNEIRQDAKEVANEIVDFVEKGEIVEARLSNPPKHAVVGTQMYIKYLPEKPKFAVIVK